MLVWAAGQDVFELLEKVKEKHHNPRLQEASIAVAFQDSKPFVRGRFNWGKTTKFSPSVKVWQDTKYDFLITLCGDSWDSILVGDQREALLDLHLECCQVEYVPEMKNENGKSKPAKDKWGRIIYTEEIKIDDNGDPKWKIEPLDLHIFQLNVGRYGCWCQDLLDFQSALVRTTKKVIDWKQEEPPEITEDINFA